MRAEESDFGFDDSTRVKQQKKRRQKFLKLQKKPFCSTGPPLSLFRLDFSILFSLPPLFKHVFANCQTLLSTPLRSIQLGGSLQREGLITSSERDNGACRASDKNPALMRKDSFSEPAGLSMDRPIME